MSDLHWSAILEDDDKAKFTVLSLESRISRLETEIQDHCKLLKTYEKYIVDIIHSSNKNFKGILDDMHDLQDRLECLE